MRRGLGAWKAVGASLGTKMHRQPNGGGWLLVPQPCAAKRRLFRRATMLAVLTCDAPVTPEVWRGMFKRGSINSFNQVGGGLGVG